MSVPVRPSIIAVLIVAALPLGCAGRVEMALVDPDKYQFHTCVQLQREMTKLGNHAQELRGLYDKAKRDSVVVARVAYEADYLSTIGDMELIEAAAREKKCDPPVAAPAGLPSSVSEPTADR